MPRIAGHLRHSLRACDVTQRARNTGRIVGSFFQPRIQIGSHFFRRAELLRHVQEAISTFAAYLNGMLQDLDGPLIQALAGSLGSDQGATMNLGRNAQKQFARGQTY